MKSQTRCPLCGGLNPSLFLRIEVPVNCSNFYRSSDEARGARKGEVALAFCSVCGMIFNAEYDPSLLEYDGNYDNSLHSSPAFQTYCGSLVQRLIDIYDLRNKTIIEVGCGSGEFLAQLCEAGQNQGVGFDPAYTGKSTPARVRIFPSLYSSVHREVRADAVCCRQVLEHISDLRELLENIRLNLKSAPDSMFYCETPNADSVLGGSTLWDVIYPHCSYFTALSLRRALTQSRFRVLRISASFEGQFLSAEAVPDHSEGPAPEEPTAREQLAVLGASVKMFAQRFRTAIQSWADLIASSNDRRIALWGAGAKAAAFLNVVPGAEGIGLIVDSNPRKRGMFIPGTGHSILSTASLISYKPDAVILLNSIYVPEIQRRLAEMKLCSSLWISADGPPSILEQTAAA